MLDSTSLMNDVATWELLSERELLVSPRRCVSTDLDLPTTPFSFFTRLP